MAFSVDKELAGWMYPESCGQWLCVQEEVSDEWSVRVLSWDGAL